MAFKNIANNSKPMDLYSFLKFLVKFHYWKKFDYVGRADATTLSQIILEDLNTADFMVLLTFKINSWVKGSARCKVIRWLRKSPTIVRNSIHKKIVVSNLIHKINNFTLEMECNCQRNTCSQFEIWKNKEIEEISRETQIYMPF